MIKPIFTKLASCYSSNNIIIEQLWDEIQTAYTQPKRHYHTLHHIQHLLDELLPVKEEVQDWNILLFSVFYHDFIYNPLRRDNEERSAAIMENRLQLLDVPAPKVNSCKMQILATKAHSTSADRDTNFFTDADLSTLGQEWSVYKAYAAAIRKEYALYPDMIYQPGRREVLRHFLQMDRIFKTAFFHSKYEDQARQNLLHELEELQ